MDDEKEQNIEQNEDVPLGWECPKCGRVWSPYDSECVWCNGKVFGYVIDKDTSGGNINNSMN